MFNKNRATASIRMDDSGLSDYVTASHAVPMLSADDEMRLALAWRDHGDRSALDVLVRSHMRLVIRWAAKFRGYGLPVADLVQEGNIGLIRGVEKFDPDRGFRVSTYVVWWIRASLTEYVMSNWSIVSLPRTADGKKLFFNLARTKAAIGEYGGGGDMPSEIVADIADKLGVSKEAVVDMNRRLSMPVSSLDRPARAGEDDSETVGSMMPDQSASPEESFGEAEEGDLRKSLLRIAVAELPERDRDIVERRHLREESETLADVAVGYGVSRERIRQIEERALRKVAARVKEMIGGDLTQLERLRGSAMLKLPTNALGEHSIRAANDDCALLAA